MKDILIALSVVVGIVSYFVYGNPTDPALALKILAEKGYTDVKLEGLSWSCSKWDSKRLDFHATYLGKEVSGRFCYNPILGPLIRTGLF